MEVKVRLFKFRAWDAENETMIPPEDLISVDNENAGVLIGDDSIEDGARHSSEVMVMQFIGIRDADGREIYEGDIIGINNKRKGCEKVTGLGVVEYDDRCFEAIISDDDDVLNYKSNLIHVIGNIFENPELFERIKNG